jgi:hypothetical protein
MSALGQPDVTLEQLRSAWGEAAEVGHVKHMAKVLNSFILYTRKRYKIDPFKEEIVGMRETLEKFIETADVNQLCSASGAIANAIRATKDTGRTFGGGLHRKPTKQERKALRGLRKPVQLSPQGALDSGDLDFDRDL